MKRRSKEREQELRLSNDEDEHEEEEEEQGVFVKLDNSFGFEDLWSRVKTVSRSSKRLTDFTPKKWEIFNQPNPGT